MVSDVIEVSSRNDRLETVLEQAEKVAAYKELSAKCALHLRLLAEEMMSMMRAIVGGTEGSFWIDDEDGQLRLHLKAKTRTDLRQREQLLSASTSGKNEAYRGFMGKIRFFFEPMADAPAFFSISPSGTYAEMSWSMRAYQEQVFRAMQQKREGAKEAWDELERSVVSHVADDVKVSIREREVELIVYETIA